MARETIFVDGGSGASVNNGNAVTVNVTPAFPDSIGRLCLALVECMATTSADNSIATMTCDGVAMQLVKLQASTLNVAIYVLPFPPKAAYAVTCTFTQSDINARMYVYELEQCDAAVPGGAVAGNSGTAASDTLTLTPIDGGHSFCVMGNALFLATLTTTATPASPFTSDDSTIVGTSPLRIRGSTAQAAQPGGSSVTAQYTYAVSKPFSHAAAEIQGEPLLPTACLMGMGF